MLGRPAGQLAYQTVGNLRLSIGNTSGVSNYNRYLDLTTATTVTTYAQNGISYRREVFASAPDQVIAIRLTADRPGSITFSATFDSPQRVTRSSPDGATAALDGISGDFEGISGPGPLPRPGAGHRRRRHASAAPAAPSRSARPTA